MKLKDLANKSFIISKDASIGMFAASTCFGLKKTEKGVLFVGFSHIDNEVYSAFMTDEYLEELTIDRPMIAISEKNYRKNIIAELFIYGINQDSFSYTGII